MATSTPARPGRPPGFSPKKSPKPKNLSDFPTYIREALAYHEAFRQLEFTPDEITFATGEGDPDGIAVGVVLVAQGKQFVCTISLAEPQSLTEIQDLWSEATQLWNRAEEKELDKIWQESFVFRNKVAFIFALMQKGIRLSFNRQHLPDSLLH